MFQILLFGAATSSIYALMAIGVTLIFGVGRIVNFAHGAFYTIGAYATYSLFQFFHLPLLLAAIGGIVITAIIAILFDYFFISAQRVNLILIWMMTFAFAFVVREVVIIIFGNQPLTLNPLWPGSIDILGVTIEAQRVGIIVTSILVISILHIFIKKTTYGRALSAVAQNEDAAQLMGISTTTAYGIVMAISAALAALAGILLAPLSIVQADMGLHVLLMAFTVVILGGIGSLRGTVVGAVLIGYGDTLVSYLISPRLVTVIALGVVLVVLILRPTGLFGMPVEERA